MESPATTILRTALENLRQSDLRTLAASSDEQVRAVANQILDSRVDLPLADLFINTRQLVESVAKFANLQDHPELENLCSNVTDGLDTAAYDHAQIGGRFLSSAELYLIADGLDLMDKTGNTCAEALANHFRNIAPRFL